MIAPADAYEIIRRDFRWALPARFNIGRAVCDDWAAREPARPALFEDRDEGLRVTDYGTLRALSDRLAGALAARGVRPGERVGIMLPQSRDALTAHVAIYKLGAVALPLAALFGADALGHRLRDSGTGALITNAAGLATLRALEPAPPALRLVVSSDGADGGALGLEAIVAGARPLAAIADTGPDDPAMMIYTSGTTGPPKGALHGHRVLLGHMPGLRFAHDGPPQPGDRFWTTADWAWAGGLLNCLLPSLMLGVSVVARRMERFDPEAAYATMARLDVRNAFIPPTALRMMRAAGPPTRHKPQLRTLSAAGETLGAELQAFAQEAFGLPVNELYGQTECNLVLGSCAALGVWRAGAIGKATPGHDCALIRPDGSRCEPGEAGEIAIARPDPVMFLGYWNAPEATAAKFRGDWMTTGDAARLDEDGYVFFVGRDDDVITSSGYRIGPGEIEDCLIKHPAVANAAVVGKPDALRTQIVKAFVVLQAGFEPSSALGGEIQAFVRARLSAHEYPREIAFVGALPMTTSGKIIRRILREEA